MPNLWLLAAVFAAVFLSLQAESADSANPPAALAPNHSPLVALSHGGQWAAFGRGDDELDLIEIRSGVTKQLVAAGHGRPNGAAWTSDNQMLVVSREDALSLFDPDARLIRTIKIGAPLSAMELSPDGRFASLIAEHGIRLIELATGKSAALTEPPNPNVFAGDVEPHFAAAFKTKRHYAWSPDSKAIAYIETNFPNDEHVSIAGALLATFALKIVEVSGTTRTVAKTDDEWPYLFRIAWSRDGRKIAYYRMNRAQTLVELRIFDGTESHTLFLERDPYWVNVPSTPRFLADGRTLIVTSERSGANHVYRYDLPSGKFQDLTPKDSVIYGLATELDVRERVYASGTSGDKQSMQVFEIGMEGKTSRQLTAEPGWHEAVMDDRGTGFLDLYSSAAKPPTLLWYPAGGTPRALSKSVEATVAFQEHSLEFNMHDGIRLPARWFKPAAFDAHRKYPVIVYVAAGPDGTAAQNNWGGWPMAWNRSMVEHGYVVLALDPRGTAGYGHLYEEYIHSRLGAQEIADLREVYAQLGRMDFVDPKRIGIWGTGYGGFIAVDALLDIHDGFKAGLAHSPVIDWRRYPAYVSERYLGLPEITAFSYLDSLATRNARRIGGTLMVAEETPRTAAEASQVDAIQSAVDRVVAKRPLLDAHFRVLHLEGETGPDEPTRHSVLFETMTNFFDSELKTDP